MRVAILTDGIFPFVLGGMQRHSHYLCRYLCELGFDVVLVHCVPWGKEKPDENKVRTSLGIAENALFQSICLYFPKSGSLPGHYIKESYAYSANVYDAIKTSLDTFDLIYAKGFSAWHLLNQKRKSRQKNWPPVAVKFHGYEMFQPAADIKSKLQHWLLRGPVKFNNEHADYIFSYGGKITQIIRSLGVDRSKIIEIPTGIAAEWLREESEITHGPAIRKLVFIGRYERRKGIEELTAILEDLNTIEKFEIHFIGPIPPSKKIKAANFIYHGQQTETEKLKSILDGCEILVTPSHSEGMPNVIMEGMARGLAVIATDVGAVAAQVDETNGWLIAPLQPPVLREALLAAIHLNANTLVQKRKKSLTKIKDSFTWEQVAKQSAEAFRRISKK